MMVKMKVVNNLGRQFNKILRKAGIKKGTIQDIRRTAISMWFATTHEFYLAIADDLIHRARVATAQGLRQKLVQNGAGGIFAPQQEKVSSRNYLPHNNLTNGQGRI